MTKEIAERLAKWREERGLTIEGQREGLDKNLREETIELKEAITNNDELGIIDALCDSWVLLENAGVEDWTIECDGDEVLIQKSFILNRIKNMGYNPYKCLLETIKEIESRVGAWCEESKKWIKDTSPEAQAKWYKADYSKCRVEVQDVF